MQDYEFAFACMITIVITNMVTFFGTAALVFKAQNLSLKIVQAARSSGE